MPDFIFDASVLSNFALTGSIDILRTQYSDRSFITDHIRMEILRGIRSGHDALDSILEATAEGWLKETALQTAEERSSFEKLSESLGLGESSCIAIAYSRGLIFACDDRTARREAERLGILLTGTLGILKKAVVRKVIDIRGGDALLNKMKSLREIGFSR